MTWIVTSSGQEIDLIDPDPKTIQLGDLIEALRKQNRFTGHTNRPYSVLDHSIECFWYARYRGFTLYEQLGCLAHDLHEGICGDVATPIKQMLPGWYVLEDKIEAVTHEALGITEIMSMEDVKHAVRQADLALLLAERDEFLPKVTTPWAVDRVTVERFQFRPVAYGGTGISEFRRALVLLAMEMELPPQFRDFIDAAKLPRVA